MGSTVLGFSLEKLYYVRSKNIKKLKMGHRDAQRQSQLISDAPMLKCSPSGSKGGSPVSYARVCFRRLQSGHVNVMEGVNVPNVSLGGDTRKASLNRKTQGAKTIPFVVVQHNNLVLRKRSGSPKESALGVVNLENGEPVVENGPTDAPVEVQPSVQSHKDSEDRMDLGSSKSKQSEAGTMRSWTLQMLTWPMNQQKIIMRTNPLAYRDFRVHIQRDAILEAPEKDVHSLRESASILSSEEIHASQSDDIKLPEE
ncbi:hypothetical protein Tco_0313201 [Tanacetum coccineum]